MAEHWSDRLDRFFGEDDLLDKYEATAVLVANSHHNISPEYLAKLRARGKLACVHFRDVTHPDRVTREFYYPYGQLREMVIRSEPGPVASSASANAERQRQWRARQKQKPIKKAG